MSDFRNHTLELWTSNSFRRFYMRDGADGQFACEPITQNDGHPDLLFPGGPDGPVARRFIAAWNACKGISTEHLEAVRKPEMSLASIFHAHLCGADEREEMLDTLREIEKLALKISGSALPGVNKDARAIAAKCAAALAGSKT